MAADARQASWPAGKRACDAQELMMMMMMMMMI
jgi:hypothetical protein